MCSLQQCRREVQAAQYMYFMLSRDCDSIDPPSTPALRSCPGSCRCVGSPALKNVKSDEQSTVHCWCCGSTAEPYGNRISLFGSASERNTSSLSARRERATNCDLCTHRETVEPCTLYTCWLSDSVLGSSPLGNSSSRTDCNVTYWRAGPD